MAIGIRRCPRCVRFLIYTDGDWTVRWQGLGQSGTLGEGFIHASW